MQIANRVSNIEQHTSQKEETKTITGVEKRTSTAYSSLIDYQTKKIGGLPTTS
jgi:hypothetical protein